VSLYIVKVVVKKERKRRECIGKEKVDVDLKHIGIVHVVTTLN